MGSTEGGRKILQLSDPQQVVFLDFLMPYRTVLDSATVK